MKREKISQDALLKRLMRIEGQVRGIRNMLQEDCECESVITQLVAARSAINGVASLILKNYMSFCFRGETTPECGNIESLARAIAIWGRVGVGD